MDSKKSKNHNVSIWLIACVLILLILASFAVLASSLKGLTSKEKEVIALSSNKEPNGFFSLFYKHAKEEPELDTYDDNASWETTTDVDLFKSSYLDPDGKLITVESKDGSKVIAPGTGNDYHFSLKNTGNVSLDYTLSLKGIFELSNRNLPFEVRLKKDNEWVVGTDDTWSTVDKLNEVVEKDTLLVGKYVGYTLEWQWPYESGEDDILFLNDINDTAIGDASAEMDVNFRLIINVVAEATPQAVAMDENGNVLYEESINPSALVAGLSMLTGGLLGLLLLLLFWRRRIYVTGLLDGYAGYSMKYKRKESVLSACGRFVFEHMPLGKCSLVLCDADGNELSTLALKLKRDSDTEGIRFEEDDDRLIIYIGKKIKAIELYLEFNSDVLAVLSDKWAAIDKDQNVYSPEGIKERDDDGRNETVAGLMVDEHGMFEIKVKENGL